MTEISVGLTIVIPGSLDPGMHFGLEVKRWSGVSIAIMVMNSIELKYISIYHNYQVIQKMFVFQIFQLLILFCFILLQELVLR